MFPNNNVTCISPWYEMRINADGSMTYCHGAKKDTWETSELSLIEWFNKGPLPKKVREQIKSGHEVEGCVNCYNIEKQNIISFRNRRNIQGAIFGGDYMDEQLKQSPCYSRLSGKTEYMYPAFLHVTLSNLCNFSCRMCFPEFSSQLKSNYIKLKLIDDNNTLIDWTNDEKKWLQFLDIVKNSNQLLSIHFMGGEPLYHKKFFEFINWCVDINRTDFHLTFVTNGSIYNKDLLDKFKLFKSVHIEISAENFHTSNDYIRTGSNFQLIKNNILSFINNIHDNTRIVLRTVPQALSIQHYDTIIDFALENKIPIDSNFLSNPDFLKINVLPKELKQKISKKFKNKYASILEQTENQTNYLNLVRHETKAIENHIKSIMILLEEKEPDDIEDLREKFIQHNKIFDKLSKLKFKDVYPDLVDFYAKYNRI